METDDEGEVTWDMGVPGVAWDLIFSNTLLTRSDLMSCAVRLVHCSSNR